MAEGKIERLLTQANDRLRQSQSGVVIFRRGQKLSLRGVLPPKPGKGDRRSQQTIALGVYLNSAGIKMAEIKAQELAADLALERFSWDKWLNSEVESPTQTVSYWLDLFEKDYFNRRERNPSTLITWRNEYEAMFRRLSPGEHLSDLILKELVLTTEPDTRQRIRACMVAQALANFAKIDIDLKNYRGNYNSANSFKAIPSDRTIAEWYHSIPNSEWQYAFGIMAAYGISNHELFYVDLESLRKAPGHLISSYRKAHYGVRKIWCLYPEWWQEWELYKPRSLPEVSGKDNRDLGSRVTRAFKRYGICKPTWIRHAWAIRAMGFMPNPMAARMMAHSDMVHNQTYQRWINEEQERKMYEILMSRRDRPLPPSVH